MSDDSVFSVQTARELVQGIRRGTHTAREITEEILAHIQNTNPDINAFITIDEEGALKAADAVDKKAAEGQVLGPLAGIPIALKDVLCTKGLCTTCASKFSTILSHLMMQPSLPVCVRPMQSSWANSIWMSLPWALPAKIPILVRSKTHAITRA